MDRRHQKVGQGGIHGRALRTPDGAFRRGPAGQAKLAAASALVVGAGGLGCPVLQYFVGAGVGHLVIVDHDTVEETNLHRQPLYRMSDIGRLKAEAAMAQLAAAVTQIIMGKP